MLQGLKKLEYCPSVTPLIWKSQTDSSPTRRGARTGNSSCLETTLSCGFSFSSHHFQMAAFCHLFEMSFCNMSEMEKAFLIVYEHYLLERFIIGDADLSLLLQSSVMLGQLPTFSQLLHDVEQPLPHSAREVGQLLHRALWNDPAGS